MWVEPQVIIRFRIGRNAYFITFEYYEQNLFLYLDLIYKILKMKKLSLLVVAALSATFIFDSCSVQKRYHRTGFNVNWNHTSVRMKNDKHPSQSEEIVDEEVLVEEKVAVKTNENIASNYTYVQENTTASVNDEVVVSENQSNTILSNASNKINDKTQLSTNEKLVIDSKIKSFTKNQIIKHQKSNKSKKSSNAEGGKSWLVALLLCIFLGALGIHRFYLGYTGLGVLYLLTGGLCGIGVLVDFIMLLVGSLKPKNDDYNDR